MLLPTTYGDPLAVFAAPCVGSTIVKGVTGLSGMRLTLRRKVHVTPQMYRRSGRAGETALNPSAPEPAPLTRDARRDAGQRWCYGLTARGGTCCRMRRLIKSHRRKCPVAGPIRTSIWCPFA